MAVSADGEVRGTATLAWGPDGTVEAAFLVEDAWFRRGVGRALSGASPPRPAGPGVPTVSATVQADNERASASCWPWPPGPAPATRAAPRWS